MTESLEAIAARFHPRERITAIRSLGSGNVNDTFLVTHDGSSQNNRKDRGAFVMQRLNTQVFHRPELVMQNLIALSSHVEQQRAEEREQSGASWDRRRGNDVGRFFPAAFWAGGAE